MMARPHFVSADDAASKISEIGKSALDTLVSQECMTEMTAPENSGAKLLVVIRDGEEVSYRLKDDATADQHYLFHSAWEISRLMRHQNEADFLPRCSSFFAGMQTGMYLALAGNTLNNALLKQFNGVQTARRKGGKAAAEKRRKRTPENEELAREIFASFFVGKVTKDAAYTRTIAKLASGHQIKMGRTTLQKIVGSPHA